MEYRTKPRDVEAAQWDPTDPAAAGAVIGLIIAAGEQYRHEGARLVVVHDGGSFVVDHDDWVVLDDGELKHFPPRAFEARYERRITRGMTPLVG